MATINQPKRDIFGAIPAIVSNDATVNMFFTKYIENDIAAETIGPYNDSTGKPRAIVENYTTLELTSISAGTQVVMAVRGQQGALKDNVSTFPKNQHVVHYRVGSTLYPFKWCKFPNIIYSNDTDKYILTCWGNLIVDKNGHIRKISDAAQFNVPDTTATIVETTKEENQKPPVTSTGVSYSAVDPVEEYGSDGQYTFRIDTFIALLYSVGELLTVPTDTGTVKSLFVFTPPVIMIGDTTQREISLIDFSAGGEGVQSNCYDCRIPYYVE